MSLTNAHADLVDKIAESFESLWDANCGLAFEEFLPPDEPLRTDVLWELVLTDLELRTKANQNGRVERYLDAYPELKRDHERLAEFVKAEFRLRSRREPGLNVDEYRVRFPGVPLPFLDQFPTEESGAILNGQNGRYRLKRPFDEGGLGKIWIARDEQLARDVALKEIKDRYSHDVASRSRFEQEALVTSRLQHPGIVPVYSRGNHVDGRPYYTMQLINGISFKSAINAFHQSERTKASGSRSVYFQRLLLQFVDVCKTVHFAHRRGVIHRDIKPSNIMLGSEGGTYLIDWGLAKVAGVENEEDNAYATAEESDSGISTKLGRALGSPAYMSPEQARGEHDIIDERTDVYSLGATLLTLLTNELPYHTPDAQSVQELATSETRRSPREISARVPGKLNAICCKAMQTDIDDRYKSAKALADDIERYLADDSIEAQSDSLIEKAMRFSRRHRAIAALLLAAPFAIAVAGLASVAIIRAERAKTERVEASVGYVFGKIGDTLDQSIPGIGRRDIRLAEALPISIDATIEDTNGDPVGRAAFLARAAVAMMKLGNNRKALDAGTVALDLFQKELGENDRRTLSTACEKGLALSYLDRQPEALALLRTTLDRATRYLGSDDSTTQSAEHCLLIASIRAGRVAESIPLLTDLAERRQKSMGAAWSEDAYADRIAALSGMVLERHFEKAESLANDLILLGTKHLSASHPQVLRVKNILAYIMRYTDRLNASISLYEDVLEEKIHILGRDHPSTLTTMQNLGVACQVNGDMDAAREHLTRAYETQKQTLGVQHDDTLTTMNNLAIFYGKHCKELDRAIGILEEVHQAYTEKFGEGAFKSIMLLNNLAAAQEESGDLPTALKSSERAIALIEQSSDESPAAAFIKAVAYKAYVRQLIKAGKAESAIHFAEDLVDFERQRLGTGDPSNLSLALLSKCHALLLNDELEKVGPLLDECDTLESVKKKDAITAIRRIMKGSLHLRQGNFPVAKLDLRNGYQLVEAQLGPDERAYFYLAGFAASELATVLDNLEQDSSEWHERAEKWYQLQQPEPLE